MRVRSIGLYVMPTGMVRVLMLLQAELMLLLAVLMLLLAVLMLRLVCLSWSTTRTCTLLSLCWALLLVF